MLVLTKSILALMMGFIGSIFIGLILIPILKKRKAKQTVSIFLRGGHDHKAGTPTMGGLIFILSTILVLIFLIATGKMELTKNLWLVIYIFLSYSLLGFIDDFLIVKKGSNEAGLSEIQKLLGQLVIAIGFFYLYMKFGNDAVLNIHTLGINLNMGWFYGAFILFMLIGSSNAVNLTDGLDGLSGGLALIAYLAFGLIAWNSTWVNGSSEMAIFCFILVGALMGFLFFNTHKAKIFMGDTGSLALGATLAAIAILTKHELTFIIIMGVFIVETLTCIIQFISIMYLHKKVFLMTPFHHHFEKLGWEETDIVKMFWFFGIVLACAGIIFAVWI